MLSRHFMQAALCCTSLVFVISGTAAMVAQNNDDQPQWQDGAPGAVGGSSPGSSGMEESESGHKRAVEKAKKKGLTSREYIGSLLALGMFYNREERFVDASKTLRQSLSIIDAGAMKPTPDKDRKPEKVIEKQHPGGVVSAEVVRTPMPYEETLQELLPQLVTAEIGAKELKQAEMHIKRLLALKGPNVVADKLAQISAYSQYAELMRKLGRVKEAAEYQRKADEINASFKPL